MPTKGTTTQRGYGWRHMQQRKRLIYLHVDGTPCDCCGKPMFKDPKRNFDGFPLEADHQTRQKDTRNKQTNLANRLLHKTCNAKDGAHAQHGTKPKPPPTPTFTWTQ